MKTRRNIDLSIGSLVLVCAIRIAHGQASFIIQHSGAIDPVSEGFTLTLGPSGAVGPVFADQGLNSWSVISSGVPVNYFQSLTPQQQLSITDAAWTLSATLRVVQAPQISLALYAGSQRYGMTFELEPDGDPIVNTHSTLSPVLVLDGAGSGYHDYELAYDSATGQASLWVDGVERVTDITSVSGDFGWGVIWGATIQGSVSEANWNHVSLEVVPEPSSLTLVGLGMSSLAVTLLHRRRRFHVEHSQLEKPGNAKSN